MRLNTARRRMGYFFRFVWENRTWAVYPLGVEFLCMAAYFLAFYMVMFWLMAFHLESPSKMVWKSENGSTTTVTFEAGTNPDMVFIATAVVLVAIAVILHRLHGMGGAYRRHEREIAAK